MFGPGVEAGIAAHAIADFPRESCGVVLREGGIPIHVRLLNEAEDPEAAFDCSAQVAELLAEGAELLAVVHSHCHRPHKDPALSRPASAGPSAADTRGQAAMGVPWGLVVTDGTNANPVFWWGEGVPVPPLENRPFRHGPSGSDGKGDCYALIRDWYLVEPGIVLPHGHRDEDWWEEGADLYARNFGPAGFRRIEWDELRRGDVVLAQVMSSAVNHGGVYLGDGLVLHHLNGKLSKAEPLGRWRNLVTHLLRYEGPGHERLDAADRASAPGVWRSPVAP